MKQEDNATREENVKEKTMTAEKMSNIDIEKEEYNQVGATASNIEVTLSHLDEIQNYDTMITITF